MNRIVPFLFLLTVVPNPFAAAQQPHMIIRPPPVVDHHGRPLDPRYAKHALEGVPDAISMPVWRSPYAYGYFGARPSRIWARHRGVRDCYAQWTGR